MTPRRPWLTAVVVTAAIAVMGSPRAASSAEVPPSPADACATLAWRVANVTDRLAAAEAGFAAVRASLEAVTPAPDLGTEDSVDALIASALLTEDPATDAGVKPKATGASKYKCSAIASLAKLAASLATPEQRLRNWATPRIEALDDLTHRVRAEREALEASVAPILETCTGRVWGLAGPPGIHGACRDARRQTRRGVMPLYQLGTDAGILRNWINDDRVLDFHAPTVHDLAAMPAMNRSTIPGATLRRQTGLDLADLDRQMIEATLELGPAAAVLGIIEGPLLRRCPP